MTLHSSWPTLIRSMKELTDIWRIADDQELRTLACTLSSKDSKIRAIQQDSPTSNDDDDDEGAQNKEEFLAMSRGWSSHKAEEEDWWRWTKGTDVPEPNWDGAHGYPIRPFGVELCRRLFWWIKAERYPINVSEYPPFNETDIPLMEGLSPSYLDSLQTALVLSGPTTDEADGPVVATLQNILKDLGFQGVYRLLGVRSTIGSARYVAPPGRVALHDSFTQRYDSKAQISCGARALAKHFHRDSTGWWGSSTGTEASKNAHAESKLETILSNAAWVNVHALPHSIFVVEVRVPEGYGCRWKVQNEPQFLGFLEPQSANGFENKFRH
eukprot:TRINITY_DN5185_c0_g1_i1.p1 TRINITY_DN5185_c0_g1~~TRINITY_DN5185_c0_g1_i1.p1  ORF type:complete len:326 (-),score=37.66 TRINITY_DN5185_c0_g1_i1:17-994(-)